MEFNDKNEIENAKVINAFLSLIIINMRDKYKLNRIYISGKVLVYYISSIARDEHS